MEQQQAALLQRYRRDRRNLMEFLLSSFSSSSSSSSLIINQNTSFSDIDFDSLSVDYLLQSLQSGGVISVAEGTKKYFDESAYPVMIPSQRGNSFFLVSDPDLAGSPPRRVPPPLCIDRNASASHITSQINSSHFQNPTTNGKGYSPKYRTSADASSRSQGNSKIPPLGLPSLITGFAGLTYMISCVTYIWILKPWPFFLLSKLVHNFRIFEGLSDDDLRESAYELLLASVFLSGDEEYSFEDRQKEKSSKFLSGLKSKRDKVRSHSQSLGKHAGVLDTVRVQMQISEAMDACIRRNLKQLADRRTSGQIDLPDISLGLLNGIFKSDFLNEKYYMQWKNRQANLLEEILCFSSNVTATDHATIRSCVAKIRDVKEWDTALSPSERVAFLASIRQVALKLSSLPGRFGIQGETCYWTAGYHLNVRLYEKLLFGVFDILDEGQLIEEAEDMLLLIKLTWPTLGITQMMHNALYGWVLFQQFVSTDEGALLENAFNELQKVLSNEEDCGKEGQYANSLVCLRQHDGSELKLSLVQAISLSISIWCDSILLDYHLHFSKRPNFRMMMNLVLVVGVPTSDGGGEIKLTKLNASDDIVSRKLKSYVKSSSKAAYRRAARKIDLESITESAHPLALLANELKLIAEREFNVFWPELRQLYPESVMTVLVLLHQFYGERLRPFLLGVSSLSEDVRSVLPAADLLDRYLTQLYNSALEVNKFSNPFDQDLEHYQIGEVSKPIILDWVISQHVHILEWSGRAFDIEDWEPLSFHQKQAASIVEVFRIIEETVDQFFGLNLPMDVTHLQALLSIIFHCLDSYLMKMLNQLVEKNHLYPSAPPLTRYTETVIPIIRKKLLEHTHLDNNVTAKLNELTMPKLCIRLNTLQYIQKQIDILEDGIRKSWALVIPSHEEEPQGERNFLTSGEVVDALFATTFNVIRDTTTHAINQICDLAGARVVFWDLRERILFHLYRGDVAISRLESFLPHFDTVLDHICGLVDDTLRDLVVLSVCRATLEGYIWVLLNGGPSRAFSDSDARIMEDDLNMLKEFFIADGEGLPRSSVEQEAKYAHQILSLFSLQTETVIRMLMNASERISMGLDSRMYGHKRLDDAHTLVRVLCHKKDREASKFLKTQYQLPMSSEYDDDPSRDSTLRSPVISDLLKRSTSVQWTKKGQSSFKSIRKKLQEATSEIKNVAR